MRNAPGNCNGTAPEYADGTKGPLSRKKGIKRSGEARVAPLLFLTEYVRDCTNDNPRCKSSSDNFQQRKLILLIRNTYFDILLISFVIMPNIERIVLLTKEITKEFRLSVLIFKTSIC